MAIQKPFSEGAQRIASERMRQIAQEGYDADHDDAHPMGDKALAAACYALPQSIRTVPLLSLRHTSPSLVGLLWPWEQQFWKPATNAGIDARVRELEKAGALIAAEIDSLLRWKAEDETSTLGRRIVPTSDSETLVAE